MHCEFVTIDHNVIDCRGEAERTQLRLLVSSATDRSLGRSEAELAGEVWGKGLA